MPTTQLTFRKRSGIQLAEPFSERRLLNQGRFHYKWSPPYILQPKLNGERCRLITSPLCCLLLSSTEEIISCLPHINQAGLRLPPGEYDGELYIHGESWSYIHSIVSRTVNLHPDYAKMEFHIFDLVTSESQAARLFNLSTLATNFPTPLKYVRPSLCHTLEDIYEAYNIFISQGYEGFIIRDINSPYLRKRSTAMMKFKPKQTDTYKVQSIIEAVSKSGDPLEMVGAFECIDDMGTLFPVGAGHLTHAERRAIWTQYLDHAFPPNLHLQIEYQTLSDKAKVPLFSRAVKLVSKETL